MVEERGVGSAEAGAALLCRAASPRLLLRSTRGLTSLKRKYKMSTFFLGGGVPFQGLGVSCISMLCVPLK